MNKDPCNGYEQAPKTTDFDTVFADLGGAVLNYLLSMTGQRSDAEDLFQETFIKVHRSLDTYREKGWLKAWVFRIAKNTLNDHWRKKKPATRELLGSDETVSERDNPASELMTRELAELIRNSGGRKLDSFPAI